MAENLNAKVVIMLCKKKYTKTDKGKLTKAKYNKSDKGKLTNAKHMKSDKGRLTHAKANAKYNKTEKGKASRIRGNHSRRAKEKNTSKDFTTKESKIVMFLQNYQCANPNCEHGRFFDILKPTLDHIIPVELGGDLIKENVQYLCQSCNSEKGIEIIDSRTPTHINLIATI